MASPQIPGLDDAWKALARTRDAKDCDAVAVRLIVIGNPATSAAGHGIDTPYEFGMQDRTGALLRGESLSEGRFEFHAGVVAKKNRTTGDVRFVGPYANGPAGDEFVYLSWRAPGAETGWLMRIKLPLTTLSWERAVEADRSGTAFRFDASGRQPHATYRGEWMSV